MSEWKEGKITETQAMYLGQQTKELLTQCRVYQLAHLHLVD